MARRFMAGIAPSQVVYEMRIDLHLTGLALRQPRTGGAEALGISVIEVMPISGRRRFGWGYDGVDLFAHALPERRPASLCRYRAWLGLGVILDVSLSFGPTKPLKHFPDYFTDRYHTG
jgi:1,4-alpha-glucan branching enzyme